MTGFGAYRDPNAPKPERPITQEEIDAVPPDIQAWADDLLGVPKDKANGAGDNHADRGDTADWLSLVQRSRLGGPLANLHNCLLALRNDPYWAGMLAYDEMARTVTMEREPCEDIHIFRAHEWMQASGLPSMAVENVREAVEIVGREAPFHPLRSWLKQLEWDGESRLANWLNRYLGTPDDSYHASIGFWFLLSMVARVMRPGCKCDYMLVLEGPQGIHKSQAAGILAGEYFSDALPDLGADHVRVSMHLRGKWLIEVSELSAFSRTEASRLKAFLTSQVEQYTPKHARKEVREPRQCVFVGTTNNDHYLLDETGGRRFWPVKCGTIDLDGLRAVRNQLLAEARVEFAADKPWWPSPDFEALVIKPEQDARYQVDAWQVPLNQYNPGVPVPMVEIARAVFDIEAGKLTVPDQRRIAKSLRNLNWTHGRVAGKGNMVWVPPRQLQREPP